MTLGNIDIINCLSNAAFFSALSKEEISSFAEHVTLKHYDDKQQLFLQGDEPRNFYVVSRGWVKVFRETLNGKESVINVLTSYETLGDEVISKQSFYPYSAEAVGDLALLVLPIHFIRGRLEQDGRLALKMLGALATHMSLLETQLEQLMVMTAPKRIGCFLLKLTRGQERGTATVTLPYDKSLIAAKLGMQAETFSRSFNNLKKAGVHIKESKVMINDVCLLRDYVCPTCSNPIECDEDQAKECKSLWI